MNKEQREQQQLEESKEVFEQLKTSSTLTTGEKPKFLNSGPRKVF